MLLVMSFGVLEFSQKSDNNMNTHWNCIIQPGETKTIEFSEESNLYITNICIPEIPENAPEEPNRLVAHIITINPHQDEDSVDVSNLPHTNVLLASLIPNVCEHQVLNITFSPLEIVKLQNQGACALHLSGYQIPISEEEEEEEEEANEEEEKDDDSPDEKANDEDDEDELDQIDIQQKLLALSKQKPVAKPPQPKPAPKPVQQKPIQQKPMQQKQFHEKPAQKQGKPKVHFQNFGKNKGNMKRK